LNKHLQIDNRLHSQPYALSILKLQKAAVMRVWDPTNLNPAEKRMGRVISWFAGLKVAMKCNLKRQFTQK